MPRPHPLIDPLPLSLPGLPGVCEGLRVAHLTDLHIRRARKCHDRLIGLIASLEVDLFLLTGDYMSLPGDEHAAIPFMQKLARAMKPRLGAFGVFGNHDMPALRRALLDLPIHWLSNQSHHLPGLPVEIAGMETLKLTWPDSLALLDHASKNHPTDLASGYGEKLLRILLCHHPTYLPTAADLGFDLMLSGHTHGGQCRLPGKRAIINSTDYPMRLTAGILRHQNTLALVSRGLGEVHLPVRLFCPRQIPVYTLSRGPLPGVETDQIINTQPW